MIRIFTRLLRTLGPAVKFSALLSALLALPISQASAQACTTVVTGKVYSPLGPTNGGDPIPNILVYIPQTAVLPFATTVGVGVTGGCAAQTNLVSGNPLVSATTDAAGIFTLSTTGLSTGTYNIVIQAGKWRRQYPNTAITACQTNAIGSLSMPAAQSTTADLPKIAVVTGSADSIECIFQQIGIAATEITDPTGPGSINLYQGATGPGQYVSASTPKESALVGVPTTLDKYDVVIFGCQGSGTEAAATATNQQNMVDYANSGGRIFATHYGYNWLNKIQPFESSATWTNGVEQFSGSAGTYPATINTSSSFPEGAILAQWLQNIGASYNGTQGQIGLQQVRTDTTAVNNPPSQSWVSLNNSGLYTGNPVMQFTFNTPIGAAGVPTVGVTYTNTTTLFKPGDATDNVIINITNTSSTDADSTLTMKLAIPVGVTVTSLVDSSGGTWTCANLVCTRSTPLAAGTTDSIGLTFGISPNITPGQVTFTASLSGGNLSSTGQCGRVLYNDYHVEQGSGNGAYPRYCSTNLTPQQRFLEFSLYNLSNFVSPTVSDVIVIQGTPTITWANPAAIYYGTQLSSTQLNATATFNGNTVPGTFTYTPAAGLPLLNASPTPYILSATFTPTDPTSYATVTATSQITVLADPTTTTLPTPVTPIYYGQTIALAAIPATKAVSTGPATINTGSLTFYIGTPTTTAVAVCTLNAANPGTCPASTGTGYAVGSYTVQACYADTADLNFTGSCSPVYNVVVQPDPVALTFPTPASPIFYGQTIAQASIAAATAVSTGPTPISTGTFTISIGTPTTTPVVVCSISATNIGKCPATTGAGYSAGTYTVQACYADTADTNFTSICSSVYTVTVQPDPTTTVITSGLDPSTPNQSVTFKAQVLDQYTTGAGTVQFFDNSGATPLLLGSVTADSTGLATLSTSALIVGTHNISACLVPSLNFLASAPCGTVVQLVILVPAPPLSTVTLLTSSANPSVVSQTVNFAASVATTGAFALPPAGTLTFYDGATVLNTATLDATGAASFSTSTLTVGTHPIKVVYFGNTTFATSTSQTVQQVVLLSLPSAGTGFLLKVAPTTLSIGVGNIAQVNVSILSLNNYNQAVQLSCSGLPEETTCTFAKSLMPVGGGTTVMTISPAAPHACGTNSPYFVATGGFPTAIPIISLTGLLLFLVRRRRRLFQGLTLAAALLLLPVLNGCSSACTDFGTQPGVYTFTVTGTSTGSTPTTQTQTMQINVHL